MAGAKTEDPTPQRLRELRRKGDVALSRELNKTAALVGALLAAAAVLPMTVRSLAALTTAAAGLSLEPLEGLLTAARVLVVGVLPVAGAAALAAAAMGAVQTGMVIAPQRIAPDAKRMKPGQVWAAKFKVDALADGTLALIATVACGVAAFIGVRRIVDTTPRMAVGAGDEGPAWVVGPVVETLAIVGAWWLGVAALVAGIDAIWQQKAFRRRNRMSKQEVRDEYKRSEGDPEHKARRERAHRELLVGDIRQGVKLADVVLANPTHLAIGLRYRPDEADAPVVTVTGRGDRAKAIRREARRRRVPEYVDRVAARSVIELEVDEPVPERLFEPVAVIFRWLERSRTAPPGDAPQR